VIEIITLVSNLGALTILGFIYVAYIKNLRSVNKLKSEQVKIAEQNIKLWKDRALESERKTPEFIEKQLNERIKIREDEVERLKADFEKHSEEINKKSNEIERLYNLVEHAQEVMSSQSVWDSDEGDFVEVPYSEIEVDYIGTVAVDAATLMICDPYYIIRDEEQELPDLPKYTKMFEVIRTKERFCCVSEEDSWPSEALCLDPDHSSVKELIKSGILKEVPYDGEWPAVPDSYIKGWEYSERVGYLPVRHHTFKNGGCGAGVSIGLQGDGMYYVKTESYKGQIQRIIIDI
jgi:hypothetical protein